MIKNIFITFNLLVSFISFSQNNFNFKIVKNIDYTTCVIELENNYKALYNLNSKTSLLDSITDFYMMENVKCVIVKVESRIYGIDESTGDNGYFLISGIYIHNYKGIKISPETIHLDVIQGMDNIVYFTMPTCTKDNQFIILENNNNLFGVISNEGKVILPFKYKHISLSENEDYFITNSFFNEEKMYSRSGERIFGFTEKEHIKKDYNTNTFKGTVKSYTEKTFCAKKRLFKLKKIALLNEVNYCYLNKQLLGEERIYDSVGNLKSRIKSHFDENEKLLQKDFYDSIGYLDCYSSFDYNNKELKIRTYKLKDNTYTLSVTKFDERGNPIEYFYPLGWNKVDDFLTDTVDFFEGNIEKIFYKFDHNGNKISEEHFDQITNDGYKELIVKKIYTYDLNYNKIEEDEYDGKSILKIKIKYTYNEKGDLTEEIKYDSQGVILSKHQYIIRYDSLGNWVKKVDYFNNKPNYIIERIIYY